MGELAKYLIRVFSALPATSQTEGRLGHRSNSARPLLLRSAWANYEPIRYIDPSHTEEVAMG